MNTDKERRKVLKQDGAQQEEEELWNLNSVAPGRIIPISLVFSSSVFICVHLRFQTVLPCA
jgi:hypothetical protein